MKIIPLTHGQFTKVDDEDFDELSKYTWFAQWNAGTKSYYALSNQYRTKTKRFHQSMQRHVMGLKYGNKTQIDHFSHDTLDNQKQNLRTATPLENMWNSSKKTKATSIYKGVYKCNGKWMAQIRDKTKTVKRTTLGLFNSEIAAALAYNDAAILRSPTFHCLNEIPFQKVYADLTNC